MLALAPFDLALGTEVRFGRDRRSEVGAVARTFGRRVALVTGSHSLRDTPHFAELVASLRDGGTDVVLGLTQSGEPTDSDVAAAAAGLTAERVQIVVAAGGGSVLDLAKAAAVVAGGVDLRAALSGSRVDEVAGIPVVALPTTAGSGAEVSRGAIVLDLVANRKRGIRGRAVAPRVAIVDPVLSTGGSRQVTAEPGFDAVAHAVETSISRAAQPFNIALAGEALRLLLPGLRRALTSPEDAGARDGNAYAAMLMGLNLATSTTCLPHRLQYPLGALSGVRHAQGVAALMPAWLRRTEAVAAGRLADLAVRAGWCEADDPQAALSVRREVTQLMADLELDRGLASFGVSPQAIPELAGMAEGTLSNDPGPVEVDDLERLYRESM
jgi:alcohol dehydrogenase class IV